MRKTKSEIRREAIQNGERYSDAWERYETRASKRTPKDIKQRKEIELVKGPPNAD